VARALVVAGVISVVGGAPGLETAGASVGAHQVVAVQAEAEGTTTTVAPSGGDGSTTTEDAGTAADDPAQDRLRLIIIGLVALAVVVLAVTILFWRATSPSRVVTVVEVDDRDDRDDLDGEPVALAADPRTVRPERDVAFATALMAPTSPLAVAGAADPVPAATPTEPAEPSEPPSDAPPVAAPDAARPRPSVRKAAPVEWPEPEPDRLDLRVPAAPPVDVTDDAPDPPRFEATAEQPAIDPTPAAPGEWTEWRGIRPLGPVERPAGQDDV